MNTIANSKIPSTLVWVLRSKKKLDPTIILSDIYSSMPIKLNFNSLSLSKRYTYISDHGKYIGVRYYYNYAINLHLVDETFYEVWYFIPDNKIEKIEQLEDVKKLDLYIKHMNELENM